MPRDPINEELERLREEVKRLKERSSLEFKVSPKGAVSVYGLGRWPVTLYGSQWKRLIENIESLQAFIEANDAQLTKK